jgi:DNA phosphorothioation-dependent restriction protein DptH
LLQDRFRLSASANSLLPVLGGSTDQIAIALVIPVDPFRGYLDDLSRAINKGRPDTTLTRPDLLVVGISLDEGWARIHLTPVEVKSRLGSMFPPGDVDDALGQAKALGELLKRLAGNKGRLALWHLGYQHLLLSMIGFGMRVYSQHHDVAGALGDWAGFHEKISSAILGDDDCVTVDSRGRLIIVDDTPRSEARDCDGDGFEETIVIGLEDAGRIIAKDAQVFYDSVRAKVGNWGMAAKPREKPVETAEWLGPSQVVDPEPVVPNKAATGLPTEASTNQQDVAPYSGIKLAVGVTDRAFEKKELSLALSDTRLNQLNMGVVGDLGTGKTQLLKSLVYQIVSSSSANRGIRPRIMIFDYKRDYGSQDFVQATEARVVRPHRLPLNLFDTSSMEDTTVPWLDRFRFFADVLDKIYSGIGPVQRDKLKRAVKSAYETKAGDSAPTIYDVHAAYAELLDGKSDSPMAIIDDLVDMQIFESDPSKTQSFHDFLDGVVVISLDALGQDDRSKNMLVAIMLAAYPVDSGSSICSGVGGSAALRGLSRFMMSQ